MHSKIYFYPHAYLRDRQLDTIRNWPKDQVLNLEVLEGSSRGSIGKKKSRKGAQVSSKKALAKNMGLGLIQKIPLINLKRRPAGLKKDTVVYCWGGMLLSGPFIVDLDNPFSLTGYNLSSLKLYRPIIRRLLLSKRCLQIRCMSLACKESLGQLLGRDVEAKAMVFYPQIQSPVVDYGEISSEFNESPSPNQDRGKVKFLFISTQFEIKGGRELLKAFIMAREQCSNMELTMITHLPPDLEEEVREVEDLLVVPANLSREEVARLYLGKCDVLLHPTYVDSFGMVLLEALSLGKALIATDVYAIKEMVHHGKNGLLIDAPISIWDHYLPSKAYYDLDRIKSAIQNTPMQTFQEKLAQDLANLARDPEKVQSFKNYSLKVFNEMNQLNLNHRFSLCPRFSA